MAMQALEINFYYYRQNGIYFNFFDLWPESLFAITIHSPPAGFALKIIYYFKKTFNSSTRMSSL